MRPESVTDTALSRGAPGAEASMLRFKLVASLKRFESATFRG